MRVDFQNTNQNVDMEKNTYRVPGQEHEARIAEMMTGYSLDITGNVTDNMAYEEIGLKSAEDIKLSAGAMDVTTQRNYMAVMSNSMSTEDFAEVIKEGYHPGEVSYEDMVTNLDKIKAKMAESGNVIEGFNDDLSADEMAKITGNPALAEEIAGSLREAMLPVSEDNVSDIKEALDKTEQIESITDSMVKYLTSNNLEPTIDNLYKAEFSAGEGSNRRSAGYYREGAYFSKKADELNWDQLKDSADKVILEAGLTDKPDAEADAKWTLEQGLPLTSDTLSKVYNLRHFSLPSAKSDAIDAMCDAISKGKRPGETIYGPYNYGKEENIYNAKLNDKNNDYGNLNSSKETGYYKSLNNNASNSEISFRRFMEETRLSMSIAANRALMRQGLYIETANLEKAVAELKETEKALFGEAVDIIQKIADQPAESIGRATFEIPQFTLRDLYDVGQSLQHVYEDTIFSAEYDNVAGANTKNVSQVAANKSAGSFNEAMKSYEAVWTTPRADMGDSIKKAFRNVDDILIDMDIELDEINRKTVRILGYTETEITKENFDRVREATRDVLEVIEKMTPEKTLEMIRDGFNPLTESVREVARYLDSKKDSDKAESYSEFIWKLDKNGEVTESEKEAYIGIYRLVRQIEKNDGRPIGDVLSSDEELTLQNLLSAVRSRKSSGLDVSIDDAFGTLETLTEKGTSISDQIMQAFDKVLKSAETREAELEYARTLRMEAKEAQAVSDSVINNLLDAGETLSTDNIMAMDHLMHMRGRAFGMLKNVLDKSERSGKSRKDTDDIIGKMKSLKDKLDEDDFDEEYQNFAKEAAEFIDEETFNLNNPVDIKEMRLLNKQLSLAGRMVRNDFYEVPVEIDGKITSVNLKIIRGSNDSSCRVTFSNEKYGNVSARFNILQDEIKGYVLTDSEKGRELLESKEKDFAEGAGFNKANIDYIVNDTVKIDDYISSENGSKIKELYTLAKAFLNTL